MYLKQLIERQLFSIRTAFCINDFLTIIIDKLPMIISHGTPKQFLRTQAAQKIALILTVLSVGNPANLTALND